MAKLDRLPFQTGSMSQMSQGPATQGLDTAEAAAETFDFLAPAEAPDEMGRLGGYRVLKVLGSGGMGVVFQAEDVQLKRRVALKAIKPGTAATSAAQQRFLREAQAAAALKHDHIVTIYQVGQDRDVPFLAMEYLEGEPMDQWLARVGTADPADIVALGRQIAQGLAAAHERGLIHRDIKPANLWLEAPHQRVKILDFGLARATNDDAQLTQQGAIIGTPAFMAPEQGRGEKVDQRCDLFSLGCVLYRMATGENPFRGPDTVSTLMAVALNEPPAPARVNAKVPPHLSDLIMKLLEKDPANRFATAREVIAALDRIAAPPTQRTEEIESGARPAARFDHVAAATMIAPAGAPTRRWPWLLVACLLLALGGTGVLLMPQIILRITGKDGNTKDIELKPGDKFEIVEGKKPQPLTFPPGVSPFDRFQQRDIPAHELMLAGFFDGAKPPPELVGILGDSTRRHQSLVESLVFSPDGKTLAARGMKSHWILWDAETFLPRQIFKVSRDVDDPLLEIPEQDSDDSKLTVGLKTLRIVFSPDGKYMVLQNGKGNAYQVVERSTNKVLHSLKGNVAPFMTIDSRSSLFAVGPDNNQIRVWDLASGNLKHTFEKTGLDLHDGVFSPDGQTLLTQEKDFIVHWSLVPGVPTKKVAIQNPNPSLAKFSPDGKWLALPKLSKESVPPIILVDPQTGQEVREMNMKDTKGSHQKLAFHPDGSALAMTCNTGFVLWDLATGQELPTSKKWRQLDPKKAAYHRTFAYSLAFSPDGKFLVTGHSHQICKWDLATGLEVAPLAGGHIGPLKSILPMPDRNTLITNSVSPYNKGDCTIRLWDLTSPDATKAIAPKTLLVQNFTSYVVLNPRRNELLVSGGHINASPVKTIDLATTKEIASPPEEKLKLSEMSLHSGRNLLAGFRGYRFGTKAALPHALVMIDPDTRAELAAMPVQFDENAHLSFDNTGRFVVARVGGTIELWDVDQKKLRGSYTFKEKPGRVRMQCSPHGDFVIAAIAKTREMHFLDSKVNETGELQFRRKVILPAEVGDFDVSPDGALLASYHPDGVIRVWSFPDMKLLRTVPFNLPNRGGAGNYLFEVVRLVFAPDGRHLIAGNPTGTLSIIRLAPPRP